MNANEREDVLFAVEADSIFRVRMCTNKIKTNVYLSRCNANISFEIIKILVLIDRQRSI